MTKILSCLFLIRLMQDPNIKIYTFLWTQLIKRSNVWFVHVKSKFTLLKFPLTKNLIMWRKWQPRKKKQFIGLIFKLLCYVLLTHFHMITGMKFRRNQQTLDNCFRSTHTLWYISSLQHYCKKSDFCSKINNFDIAFSQLCCHYYFVTFRQFPRN